MSDPFSKVSSAPLYELLKQMQDAVAEALYGDAFESSQEGGDRGNAVDLDVHYADRRGHSESPID